MEAWANFAGRLCLFENRRVNQARTSVLEIPPPSYHCWAE